ncbi:hypothetical protein ECC02_004231 [Trypanosoma cruzi]|uniref:Uncharacterized protein n=1 Tax=Trypanosoma cruzi TaxID=5693 RepID=A0A7J6Y799_TRYCR|nr:hypothetical protein ECC02_004231 [Trypanosoma cruzi]
MAGIAQVRQSASGGMQRASHTHPSNGTVIPTAGTHAAASQFQHGTQLNIPPSPKTFFQSTVRLLICVFVCVLEQKKKQREAHRQHSKRHSRMAAIHAVRPQPQPPRTVAAHTALHIKENKQKNMAAGCGCVCGAAGVCPPWPQKKQNKRGRNVCSAPQALVARPHVTAPSARRSSRPLLMRAAGEAHRAVVMSVSVGVRVEQLGGKHTAPLTGRVQQETIKKGNEG